jgi:hypothetical protein
MNMLCAHCHYMIIINRLLLFLTNQRAAFIYALSQTQTVLRVVA